VNADTLRERLLAARDMDAYYPSDDGLTVLCRTAWHAAAINDRWDISNLWFDIERDHRHAPGEICADYLVDCIRTAAEITLAELHVWIRGGGVS
jgi:hypothetical protein